MIDIENEVINTLIDDLREAYTDIWVYGEEPKTLANFPTVTVEQLDNSVYQRTQDSGSIENHARVMFQVSVYTNAAVGRKSQAKGIFETVNETMSGFGLTRTMLLPVQNLDNRDVFRLVGRYTGVVSTSGEIFRR